MSDKDDVPIGTRLFKPDPLDGTPSMAKLLDTTILKRDHKELIDVKCPECGTILISMKFSENGWLRRMSVLCVPCGRQGKIIEAVAGTGEKQSDVIRENM